MKTPQLIEWVVLTNNGRFVSAWPNDQEEWCWGAKTGQSNELCGGCPYCLELQGLHADCKVEFIMAPENPEQSDLFGPPRRTFWQRYKDPIIVAVSVVGYVSLYLLLVCFIIFSAQYLK